MTMRILDKPATTESQSHKFIKNTGTINFNTLYTVPLKISNTWCAKRYPNHPHGCPNLPQCQYKLSRLRHASTVFDIQEVSKNTYISNKPMMICYATFDLAAHEEWMGQRHPTWTKRQCRNLLYWQPRIDKIVYQMAKQHYPKHYAMIGEGFGINVYKTCRKAGLMLHGFRNCTEISKLIILLPLRGV